MSEEQNRSSSTQTRSTYQRIRSFLKGILLIITMIGIIVIGFILFNSYRTIQTTQATISNPIQAIMKKIGVESTPVVYPDPVIIINDLTRMAQLQTAEISMTEIFSAQVGTEEFFGLFEDSMIFVAVGQVTAGIDLAKLTPNDIEISSFQTATIRLPQPEIFVVALDNEQSRVMNRDTGLLIEANPQLETEVRRAAVKNFEKKAIEEGLLDEATASAQETIGGLITSLGFGATVFIDETGLLPTPISSPELPKGYFITD